MRAGSTSRISGGTILTIENYFIHPKYDRILIRFDIAMVRTSQSIPIKQFAVLPPMNATFLTGTRVTVMGWGNTVKYFI